ncbi:unnamed protein product [Amoebophrya sp. A25]|nr:unnamed protein product [Amoebophrya sp. A25]|eukprot:GSA25T00013908001.1
MVALSVRAMLLWSSFLVVFAAISLTLFSPELIELTSAAFLPARDLLQKVIEPLLPHLNLLWEKGVALYQELEQNAGMRYRVECAAMTTPVVNVLLGPLPSFITVVQRRSIGNLPCFPFAFRLGNNSVWLAAGVGLASPTVCIPNAFGTCVGLAFALLYLWAIDAEEKDLKEAAFVDDQGERNGVEDATSRTMNSKSTVTTSQMKSFGAITKDIDHRKTRLATLRSTRNTFRWQLTFVAFSITVATGLVALSRSETAKPKLRSAFERFLNMVMGDRRISAESPLLTSFDDFDFIDHGVLPLASVLTTLAFAAPATNLHAACSTWDASYMGGVFMLFCGLGSGTAWFLLGAIWMKKNAVVIPNALGILTNSTALLLYLIIKAFPRSSMPTTAPGGSSSTCKRTRQNITSLSTKGGDGEGTVTSTTGALLKQKRRDPCVMKGLDEESESSEDGRENRSGKGKPRRRQLVS